MKRRLVLVLLATVLLTPAGFCSPPQADFSGLWRQSNERCVPVRTGDVTQRIEQRGSELIVETTIVRSSGPSRHAAQRYSTDGKTTVSTGADGDEFHTSIAWSGGSMVFAIEEHEDGQILRSKETWTLIENGAALQRIRESLDASGDRARKQTLIYVRQASGVASQ